MHVKKTTKKLSLRSEILRPLQTEEAARAAGAANQRNCSEIKSGCAYTVTNTCPDAPLTLIDTALCEG